MEKGCMNQAVADGPALIGPEGHSERRVERIEDCRIKSERRAKAKSWIKLWRTMEERTGDE